MDDSVTYTGVDEAPNGPFGNEGRDRKTQELLNDQKRKIRELTPQLSDIVAMLEKEKQVTLDFIASYVDATNDSEENIKAELKAAGRYRKYLDDLTTKFRLALNETKRKD